MKCDCFTEVNNKLREQNLKLISYAFKMPGFQLVPTINTQWVDKNKAPKGKKNRPTSIFASHCPFCGVEIATNPEN